MRVLPARDGLRKTIGPCDVGNDHREYVMTNMVGLKLFCKPTIIVMTQYRPFSRPCEASFGPGMSGILLS